MTHQFPHPLKGQKVKLSLLQVDPNGLVQDGDEVLVQDWYDIIEQAHPNALPLKATTRYETRSLFSGFEDWQNQAVVVTRGDDLLLIHNYELEGQKPGPDTIDLTAKVGYGESEAEDDEFELWNEEYKRLQRKYPQAISAVIIGFMLKNAIAEVDLGIAQLSEDVAAGFE